MKLGFSHINFSSHNMNLQVKKEYEGQGIGSALVSHCIDIARKAAIRSFSNAKKTIAHFTRRLDFT
ncbi:MAG: GNAT family N-acetyltransferase [Nanoarchaeota archaeon]